jgi:menaquinone-dependent protoporphyrinogen IX oxidase
LLVAQLLSCSILLTCALPQARAATFALKLIASSSQTVDLPDAKHLLQRELRVTPIPVEAADQVGLIVFNPPSSLPVERFKQQLNNFVQKHSTQFRLMPVFTTSGGYTIPTGRIIVQFKDGITDEQARKYLARTNVTVVQQPTKLRPSRFVIEADSNSPTADPIILAKTMASNPSVRLAEPDMLIVSTDDPLVK